jgi:hypothetical protein
MRALAALLLLGSLLPLANWIPGGETDPAHAARLADWGLGFGLCAAVGVLAWFVSRARGASAGFPPAGSLRPAASRWDRREASLAVGIAVLALGLYTLTAQAVLSGRPLLIDEIVHVLQARDLAAGQLTHAIPGPRPFFAIMHEVDFGARAFGQYPIGGPAMLLPGAVVGAEWLVNPVVGALCVLLFWRLVAAVEPQSTGRFRVLATLLFAVTPFGVFMFASHMNHATVLLWLLVAAVAVERATREDAALPWALVTGLALGIAATIRPLDAAAYALPAAGWLAWNARRGARAALALVLSGIGVAVPMAVAFWVNLRTTGHPFTFGYDLLWGAGHSLGFHSTPWGAVHTPQRGVELIGLYLSRLNTYLFEVPLPSLLVPAAGLWWARRLTPLDRYLLASTGLVAVGYWAYWHDGFYLGPRFLFAWLPALVLWSARGVRAALEVTAPNVARRRGAVVAGLVAVGYAALTLGVERIPAYRNGLQSLRLPTDAAARAGVRDALILVQESWGAQLIVRLWEAGVSRPDAEVLYRHVDACMLEETLQALARDGVTGEAALDRLRPLMADSARLVPSDLSPDFTERRLPGLAYTPTCTARIEDDRRGYLLYAPWRLVRDGNVYARWLPGREAEIRGAFPARPAYRLRRAGSAVDAPLVFERLPE